MFDSLFDDASETWLQGTSRRSRCRAPDGHSVCVCMPSFPVGQKLTCGQGLEGPWERPPPLDEPQRDGNSEDQGEDRAALSGELWSVGWGGGWKPRGPSQALSPLCLSFRAPGGASAPYPPMSLVHKLRVLHLQEEVLPRNPLCPHPTLYPFFYLLGLRLLTSRRLRLICVCFG